MTKVKSKIVRNLCSSSQISFIYCCLQVQIMSAFEKNKSICFIDLPEQDAHDGDLHSCPICNRKFRSDVYGKHVSICEKMAAKKRKTFGMYMQIIRLGMRCLFRVLQNSFSLIGYSFHRYFH